MMKKIPKLNSLQVRTLALFQVLAENIETSSVNPQTGEVAVAYLPEIHGDHVHIGTFVVSRQDASGFANEAVWRALERKGLIKSAFPVQAILTKEGLAYETDFLDKFTHSDH